MTDPGKDPHADWLTIRDAVSDLLAGVEDPDGFTAALAALRQASSKIEHRALLNTPLVPQDAGEHAERLAAMLARIPDGWGRWISCSRGWYPIICELDEQLARLFPNYRIHQVKEKFAGLRYYWESGERLSDPEDPEPEPPADEGEKQDAGYGEAWKAWHKRQAAYAQTPAGQARAQDARRRAELAQALVNAAQARAASTCERCGAPGSLRCTRAPSAWYQTLCERCASERGMLTPAARDAWWEQERPRFEARQRAAFVDANAGKLAVIIGTPEQFRSSLPEVSYLSAEDEVRAAAMKDPAVVFLADGPLSLIYANEFRARHAEHERRIESERTAALAAHKPYAYPRPDGCPEMHKVGALPREVYERLSALGVTYRLAGPAALAGPLARD